MRVLAFVAACVASTDALGAGSAGGLDWRYFAAGGVSAAVSHGYTTPLDVIKTRMQTNPELYNGSVPLALSEILQNEGAAFLLQGLGPTCVGYGLEGALKFGCYELAKPIFKSVTPSDFANAILASCVAGGVAALVLCPPEDVRIRMVSDPDYARNSVEGFKRRVAEDGPLASFAAVPAMTAKQVPYTMGKQVSFDYACELVHALLVAVCSAELLETVDGFTPVIAALPAAVLACVLSHPGDAVLTQFFKRGPQPGGVAGSVGLLIKEGGGPLALFTGLKARLLHVIGIIWVQLIIYDKVKVALGLPATGH